MILSLGTAANERLGMGSTNPKIGDALTLNSRCR